MTESRTGSHPIGSGRRGGRRGAMPSTWQAAAWYLERSYPERWGRRVIAPESQSGGSFLVQLHNLSRRMGTGEDE